MTLDTGHHFTHHSINQEMSKKISIKKKILTKSYLLWEDRGVRTWENMGQELEGHGTLNRNYLKMKETHKNYAAKRLGCGLSGRGVGQSRVGARREQFG